METVNPLRTLVGLMPRGQWVPILSFCVFVATELRNIGINVQTNEDLATVITLLRFSDFIEHNPDSSDLVRIVDRWYDSV